MIKLNENFPTVDNALRSTWNSVVHYYNKKGTDYDISLIMGLALINIDEKKGTPSTQLGPKMGMLPTSLSRPLRHFEDRGLIERHPDPNDGRGVIIKLTSEGMAYRKLIENAVTEFNQEILSSIEIEKLDIFFEVCLKILKITKNN